MTYYDFDWRDEDAEMHEATNVVDENLMRCVKEELAELEFDQRAGAFYRWLDREEGYEFGPFLAARGASVMAHVDDYMRAEFVSYRAFELTDQECMADYDLAAEINADIRETERMLQPGLV